MLFTTFCLINAISAMLVSIAKPPRTYAHGISTFAPITIHWARPIICRLESCHILRFAEGPITVLPLPHKAMSSSLPSAHSCSPSHTHNCGMHLGIPFVHEKCVRLQSGGSANNSLGQLVVHLYYHIPTQPRNCCWLCCWCKCIDKVTGLFVHSPFAFTPTSMYICSIIFY